MSLADSVELLIESIVELPSHFADVAAHDPVSAVVMAFGILFVGAASAVFGYLSLGAFVSLFTRDWSTEPPRGAR